MILKFLFLLDANRDIANVAQNGNLVPITYK